MTKSQRYVVRQLMVSVGTHMRTDYHELWRIVNVEKEGLTEKERAFLNKTLEDFDAVCERVSKFGSHLHKTLQ